MGKVDYNMKSRRVAAKGTQKPVSKRSPIKKGTVYRLRRPDGAGKYNGTQNITSASDMSMMRRFMGASRKLTGTQLNRKPVAKTDSFDDPKLNRSPNGVARGRAFDDKLNNKPMNIRQVNKPQNTDTKLTASKNKPGLNKRNKGIVRKYK